MGEGRAPDTLPPKILPRILPGGFWPQPYQGQSRGSASNFFVLRGLWAVLLEGAPPWHHLSWRPGATSMVAAGWRLAAPGPRAVGAGPCARSGCLAGWLSSGTEHRADLVPVFVWRGPHGATSPLPTGLFPLSARHPPLRAQRLARFGTDGMAGSSPRAHGTPRFAAPPTPGSPPGDSSPGSQPPTPTPRLRPAPGRSGLSLSAGPSSRCRAQAMRPVCPGGSECSEATSWKSGSLPAGRGAGRGGGFSRRPRPGLLYRPPGLLPRLLRPHGCCLRGRGLVPDPWEWAWLDPNCRKTACLVKDPARLSPGRWTERERLGELAGNAAGGFGVRQGLRLRRAPFLEIC